MSTDWYWELVRESVGLEFAEREHRYTFEGEVMDSVTTVLKGLCVPFDSEHHAARIAERDGTLAEVILAQWKDKADKASAMGTYVHNQAERIAWDLVDHKRFSCVVGDHPPEWMGKVKGMWQWYIDHLEIIQGIVFPELKVVWPEMRIAGTVDLVVSNYQGVPTIADWKTNASIDVHGFRNMLPPFQRGKLKLDDSNFWTYALQLNMYRRIMLERYNYEAERLVLIHLPGHGQYVEYDVPFMDDYIEKILEMRNG